MPMKNPPHPGDFIRTEIIEAAGLTVTLHKRESARNKSVCRVLLCWLPRISEVRCREPQRRG